MTALHVALTFDDDYWAPAYATMRSICLSTRRRTDLRFHLFEWQLSPKHRAQLDAIATEFGAEIRHLPLNADPDVAAQLAGLPAIPKFPALVYARLLLDQLLPPEIDRFIYLDCDVYVRVPIETLLAIDLAGHSLAAAPEPGRQHLIGGTDMRDRQSPFDTADPYFNSGVLVVDRRRWSAARLDEHLAVLVESGEIHSLYHDQDVLNLAFRDNWLALDPRWNLTKPHPALRALDPFIVHYTTGQKPWNTLAYVAFGSSYKHVMTRPVRTRYLREQRLKRLKRLFRLG